MRLLRALVLPLVSVSMVCGVLALFARTSGFGREARAARLVGAYAVTTCVACAIGLVVVRVVRPGAGISVDGAKCGSAAGATERDDDEAAPLFRRTRSTFVAIGARGGSRERVPRRRGRERAA